MLESKDLQSADIFCVPARAYIEAMASGNYSCWMYSLKMVNPKIDEIKEGLKKILLDENLRQTLVSNM